MLRLTDRVARTEATAGQGAADDYLVLDLSTGRYFALGEVGGFIWQRLDGEADLASIAGEVAEHFAVQFQQAAADLLDFVSQLIDSGLGETVAERAATVPPPPGVRGGDLE